MIGCVKSELSLFDAQQFQTTMDKGMYIDYHALTNLDANGPIEFTVSGTTEEYIDVNDTMLYIKAKITKADGTNIDAGGEVAFTNMPLSSLFADVQLYLNEHQIEGGNQMYPYRAMISALIQNSESTKTHQLLTSGYVKDTAGKMNTLTNDNLGFRDRKAWSAESISREFCGPLHLDFLQQSKYLLGQVDIRIKLIRARSQFALMRANGIDAQKIVIEDAVLLVRKVKVAPSVINGHESGLAKHNVIYPLQRCEVVSYTIETGTQKYTKDNLFKSQMPKLLIFGLVSNAAFSGAYLENPFNFQHFGVNYIALHREGETIPHQPFKPDFANKLAMREYMALYQAMEYYNRDAECGITYADFLAGTTLYAFNLAPDMCISGHAQPMREGNLRLEINFAAGTGALINVIVWAVFDSKLEITRTRDILLDYKS